MNVIITCLDDTGGGGVSKQREGCWATGLPGAMGKGELERKIEGGSNPYLTVILLCCLCVLQ